jgi:aspartyl/glutamyl-tRNA(Asn/Gln) amidotransferase C subunit
MLEIKDIEKLSKLARIELTDDEKSSLLKEVDPILNYIAVLKEVVGTLDGDRGVSKHRNITRPDINTRETGINTESIVDNMPDSQDNYLKVKKIL